MSDYIAMAIPFFFVLIGVELLVARLQRRHLYRFHDAITDLSCGIGQQVTGVLVKGALFAVYVFVYEHTAVLELSSRSWVTWVVGMVGIDCLYYGWHRMSHRINLVWAAHVVHHQSQDYNLAVALRQAWFTVFSTSAVYLVLAVVGVPPAIMAASLSVNTLYQFWIHTRAVGKLGPLEWFLNTPSHHRVHHGIDPKYVDKNYAGILIVWDRLFGTFQAEQEEPVYGTVKPYESWNPIWANVEPLLALVETGRAMESRWDAVKLWFMPPDWRPDDLGGPVTVPEVDQAAHRKYDTRTPRALDGYVLFHFVLLAVGVTALLFAAKGEGIAPVAVAAAIVLWTSANFGAIFEQRRWALPSELFRLALLAVMCVAWTGVGAGYVRLAALAGCAAGAASAAWLVRHWPRRVAAA